MIQTRRAKSLSRSFPFPFLFCLPSPSFPSFLPSSFPAFRSFFPAQNLHELINTGELHCTEQELHKALLCGELGPKKEPLPSPLHLSENVPQPVVLSPPLVELGTSSGNGKCKSEGDVAQARWRCRSETDVFNRPSMARNKRRKSTELLADNDPSNYLHAVVNFEDFQMFIIAVQKDALQKHLHETWQQLDHNKDGYLSAGELQSSVRNLLGGNVSKQVTTSMACMLRVVWLWE